MDWHHPPPPPPPPGGALFHGTICPVCSYSHFPFCPPPFPPSYQLHPHPHPHPPPHAAQFYPRAPPQAPAPASAPYDPFVDHHVVPGMNPHRPPVDPQRPWNASSSGFDRDPYGNMFPGYDYSTNGPKRMPFDDSDNVGAKRMPFDDSDNVGAKRMPFDDSDNVEAKRMRFGDPGLSSDPIDPNFYNPSSVSADTERRLKLIRDHGGVSNHQVDGNFGEQRNFDGRTDLGFKPPDGPRDGGVDRKRALYSQENILNMHKVGEEQYGREHIISNGSVVHEKYQNNQVRSIMHQKNIYEYSGSPTDGYSRIQGPRHSQEGIGYNRQGVSGVSAVYTDPKSGISMESSHIYDQYSQKDAMQRYIEPSSSNYLNNQGGCLQQQSGMNIGNLRGQHPLPASPPPPLPLEAPGKHSSDPFVSPSTTGTSASLFPVSASSPAFAHSSYPPHPETSPLPSMYNPHRSGLHAPTGFGSEEYLAFRQTPSKIYVGGNGGIPLKLPSPEAQKIIDASHIIKNPHRATRPDHIVIILRGLPGSGKSYLAKMLRDLEVENGGNVPRIHCMDDYFMTEVEKVEESESSKPSGSVRGKKQTAKKVIEYCYEPEMEEAYRSSMLKSFKKTLDEGAFSFVIVDDRNLRVADFAQFWATAKRSGYEVYLLEAAYKDPAGCAARNVHGFTQDDIQKMVDIWEEVPPMYLKLNIKSLLHGDGFEESEIQEVDMDMEDGDGISEEKDFEKIVEPKVGDHFSIDSLKDNKRMDAEADHPIEEVKELGKSKWSNDLDDDDFLKNEAPKRNLSALSGLIQSYSKEGKSVRWGDEVGKSGFSISAAKTANVFSLVIGPGAGYNLKSNPLLEEEKMAGSGFVRESKKQHVLQERLRAESESFRAVFDKRRQRIGGLEGDDE